MCIEVLTPLCDYYCWELTPREIVHDIKGPNHTMTRVGVIVFSSTLSMVGTDMCTRFGALPLTIWVRGVDYIEGGLLIDST